MRKSFVLVLIFLVVCLFIFTDNEKEVVNKKKEDYEKRVVFISYIELSKYVKNKDVEESKKNISQMVKNIKDLGFNTIILQVRSFSDAIYKSNIFPWSSCVAEYEGKSPGYDVLEYFINVSHSNNIKLHAWLNPYRVRTSTDVSTISKDNPAYKYINTDTLYINNGIYYNPAKKEVNKLIVSGIDEILDNYDVDGICFDDYFYPDKLVSERDYLEYKKDNPLVSFDEFRLMTINKMIEDVHKSCENKNKPFGISPSGNIENNYDGIYADVKKWGGSDLYVDYLMPQIYYGFFNEAQAFHKVLKEWDNLITNNSIELVPALAFYKVGEVDKYARDGSTEWVDNNDIIMREILLSRNLKNYNGFALYRYDYLFNDELKTSTTMKEIENMKKILK